MERLNKTRAFLTEFIIVILFFSVAAVITINLYVEANRRNDENLLMERVSMQAQSVAENIRAKKEYYSKSSMHTEFLDEDMNIVREDEATYVQRVIVSHINKDDKMVGKEYQYDIVISLIENNQVLYSLKFRQYVGKEEE